MPSTGHTPNQHRVGAVRAFNRFYTNVIGLLGEGLLGTPYSLTEARIIFELAQDDAVEVVGLRRALDIDAGYLSRILARFEADGIAARERSSADRRRQLARLTKRGRRAFELLDARSGSEIQGLLSRLSDEDQRRLIGAMDTIRRLLESSSRGGPFLIRPPGPGDFGWVVQRHGELYHEEYGWDETFEALVARIVAEYVEGRDPKRESAWIAEIDGEAVGCVFCMRKDDRTAKLRLLLVEPQARRMGIGARLVEQCVGFARTAGYEHLTLWTNDVLKDARRLYERTGFTLVDQERHRSFGRELIGQNWSLEL
jgi:DNA-binding MarR family transcriptional regulator/N-acetylglutamate synthase-like GNAT family acetyltransferase